MKKIKLILPFITAVTIGVFYLSSCSSDSNKEQEIISSKYRLEEFSKKTSLTNFAANHAIYNMSLTKVEANKFKVTTESYGLAVFNKQKTSNYFITLADNIVILQTNYNGKLYKLIKNDSKNEASFQIDKQIFLLNESFFESIGNEDDAILDLLVSIFVELYDNNATRLTSNVTRKVAVSIAGKTASACLKFESGVGLTASASTLRASTDAKEYISDGNSDCNVVGSDTSCVIDAHVCVTTVTMSCTSSCNWWN